MRIKRFKQFEKNEVDYELNRQKDDIAFNNKRNSSRRWFEDHPLDAIVKITDKPLVPDNMSYHETTEGGYCFSIQFNKGYISGEELRGGNVKTRCTVDALNNNQEFISWLHKAMISQGVSSRIMEQVIKDVTAHLEERSNWS